MNNHIDLNINIARIEDIRIKLNGTEYMLTPVTADPPATEESHPTTLADYVSQLVDELNRYGRRRTAETYRCALNSFSKYLPQPDITLDQIDAPLISNYERYLTAQGLTHNTTSFYMRVLRTIYRRAVQQQLTTDRQPFAYVYTGIGKTVKRAITLADIHRIRLLDQLTEHESLARDLFLFSLYTRGMAFVDMAYLSPDNIRNGTLTYRRQKTGQQLTIHWEPQMQEIVDRHPSRNDRYLLPIIKRSNGRERSQYRECQRLVNHMLKSVGRKAHITQPLTMYVARHSWASIAYTMDIPLNIISQGMGHSSEKTTLIYLKSLDTTRLDKMNASIISAVNSL